MFEVEGAPEIVQSDNGKEFRNKILHSVMSQWGVNRIYGRPRCPKSQGQVERLNQTICRGLAKALHGKPKRWIDIHKSVVLAYNTSYHSAIGKTPFCAFRKREYKRVIVQEDFIEDSNEQTYEAFAPSLVWLESENEEEEVSLNEAWEFLAQDDALVAGADAVVSAHNSQYNQKMNAYKNVHERKRLVEAGDAVLLAKDFDNNQATKRGKFDSFYELSKFEVLEVVSNTTLKVQNGSDVRTVSKSKVKKVRKARTSTGK